MSKIKDFFIGLNKSTKMTMLSCGCFILLTLVILCFFMWFPITPSERAISSLGREGLVYNGTEDEPAVTTTAPAVVTGTGTTTTTVTTTVFTSFIGADVTTYGTGYLSGNVIPTGSYVYEPMPSETVTTTTAPAIEEPTVTTTDPNLGGEGNTSTDIPPEPTDPQPTDPPVEPTDPPVEPTDPPVTDAPVVAPEDTPVQAE